MRTFLRAGTLLAIYCMDLRNKLFLWRQGRRLDFERIRQLYSLQDFSKECDHDGYQNHMRLLPYKLRYGG
jgi:hypothetical protein